MDYKEAVELVKFHSVYSNMTKAECLLIMFMVASVDYKKSTITASYNELADAIGLSKSAVIKGIESLIKKKAICVDQQSKGRMQSTYRLRSAKELKEYFTEETRNPKHIEWEDEKHRLFDEMLNRYVDIGLNCTECEEEEYCPQHKYQKDQFEKRKEYRDYKLWIYDNPEPEMKIKIIMGKEAK